MSTVLRRCCFGLLMICLLALATSAYAQKADAPAEDEQPYKHTELRKLIQKYREHDIVLEQVRLRGLEMKVTSSTQRTLAGLGFNDIQTDALIRIAERNPAAAPHQRDTSVLSQGRMSIGPRMPDAYQQRQDELIDAIISNTGLPLEKITCGNVTLVATKTAAKKLTDHITKTNEMVKSRYPGAFNKGLNPKSAHIVVLDDTFSYKKWVDATFEEYQRVGRMNNEQGGDPKGLALSGSGWNMGHMTVNDGSKQRDIMAKTAFDVGYLYASELSEGRAPAALICGFGNVIETMMVGEPGTMLISYDKRELDRQGGWATLVLERMKKNEHTKPGAVLLIGLDTMKGPQYAESWSVTDLVSSAPTEFDLFLKAMRDGKDFVAAFQSIYDIDLATTDLEKSWIKHAQITAMQAGRRR